MLFIDRKTTVFCFEKAWCYTLGLAVPVGSGAHAVVEEHVPVVRGIGVHDGWGEERDRRNDPWKIARPE
jgi:hypothetical protein